MIASRSAIEPNVAAMRDALEFIVSQSAYTFAECTLAEEIISRARAALDAAPRSHELPTMDAGMASQIAEAQREVAAWPEEKRRSVQLEGTEGAPVSSEPRSYRFVRDDSGPLPKEKIEFTSPASSIATHTGSICLPVKLYHRNVPIGDTGDYDGVTEIKDDEGTVLCEWWNANEKQEQNADEIVALLNRFAPSATWRICEWKPDDDGIYNTTCGNAFVFTDPGPKENNFKHCCYCGGELGTSDGRSET